MSKTVRKSHTARKIKQRIASTIMLLGILTVAIGLISIQKDYPWRAVLINAGLEVAVDMELPDPQPLPRFVQEVAGDAANETVDTLFSEDAESVQALSDSLETQPGLLDKQPEIQLEQIGIIQIPKIGISENIVEGSKDELLYGVGHVRGTAKPGMPGNCALAGHRNYRRMHPFRHLDQVGIGDDIRLKIDGSVYHYEVFDSIVVQAQDEWILDLDESEENLLTLITCTPVLNPVDRLVLRCRLTTIEAN